MQIYFEKKDQAPIQSEQFLIIGVHKENKTGPDVAERPNKHLIVSIISIMKT